MTYKIDFPISNYVGDTERTLGGYIDLVGKYNDDIETLYFPLGYIYEDVNVWGIRAPSYVYGADKKLSKENVLRWENAVQQIVSYTNKPVKILMNNIYSQAFASPKDLQVIAKKLEFYANRYKIESVVIADTQLIPFLQDIGLPVCLSTNSHNSLSELDMIFQIYGESAIKSFTLQRDHNRQPSKVKAFIKRRGIQDKLVLMVNEGCINACPYKQAGDIEISIDQVQNKTNKIHIDGCAMLERNIPWSFLTSQFLSKTMIEEYYPEVKTVKISGRDKSVSQLKYMLKHWVDGEDQPLSKILNVNGGFPLTMHQLDSHPTYTKDVMTCTKECFTCNKCQNIYNEFIIKTA
jgi:hypothetical protein